MNGSFNIRDELPSDARAISEVTIAAFSTAPHSSRTEQFIAASLRRDGALSVSLVAEVERQIVGHIAFSPVAISDGSAGWYGLGPVSVLPSFQRRGIGQALVQGGLARLRALVARGCVVLGAPGYYRRFGFSAMPGLTFPGPPPEFFMALSFAGSSPQGAVIYHEAFDARA